jgi:hypothetical protein
MAGCREYGNKPGHSIKGVEFEHSVSLIGGEFLD